MVDPSFMISSAFCESGVKLLSRQLEPVWPQFSLRVPAKLISHRKLRVRSCILYLLDYPRVLDGIHRISLRPEQGHCEWTTKAQ